MAVSGTLKVSNDCIADLAGYAALECYGVVGMAYTDAQSDVVSLLATSKLRKGIDVSVEDGLIVVGLHIIVESGINMASVSSNLKSQVAFVLKQIAQLDNTEIRVHIEGIRSN